MGSIWQWMELLRARMRLPAQDAVPSPRDISVDTVIHAQGHMLALLATLLERERIISSAEFARSLGDFATLTAADHPNEGYVLALWAAHLREASSAVQKAPSIQ